MALALAVALVTAPIVPALAEGGGLHPRTDVFPTTNGPVRGYRKSLGLTRKVEVFQGIPFAAPPVGARRFRSPEKPTAWTDVFSATKPGALCPQIRPAGPSHLGREDCLYLNVYKPKDANNVTSLPVMFWIYGGGYVLGDGFQFGLYDAARLAATHNVVVVTHNYRLGALGFMALDELKGESPQNSTGNYGVQDQQMALQWTHDNIRNFGGDPGRITIFGESAGGFSVMWHLVNEVSKSLFQAAIMESGTNALSWFFQPYEDAKTYYEDRAAILGCPDTGDERLDCLRKLPAKDFLISFTQDYMDIRARDHPKHKIPDDIPAWGSPIFPAMPNGPVIDGTPTGLLDVPINLVRAGKAAQVPLILGSNRDGGNDVLAELVKIAVPGSQRPNTNATLEAVADWILNNVTQREEVVNSIYPYAEFENSPLGQPESERIDTALRDSVFMCPNRRLARAWTDRGLPAYLYSFSFNLGPLDKIFAAGDFHASELPFLFKTYLPEIALLGVPHPEKISDTLSCRWARFAYCHDPNRCEDSNPPGCENAGTGAPRWPSFEERNANGTFYSLKETLESVDLRPDNVHPDDEFPSHKKCDFWDRASTPFRNLREYRPSSNNP